LSEAALLPSAGEDRGKKPSAGRTEGKLSAERKPEEEAVRRKRTGRRSRLP